MNETLPERLKTNFLATHMSIYYIYMERIKETLFIVLLSLSQSATLPRSSHLELLLQVYNLQAGKRIVETESEMF